MISTSKTILNQKYVALNIVIYWFCALLVYFLKLRCLDRFLGVPFLATLGAKEHLASIKVR